MKKILIRFLGNKFFYKNKIMMWENTKGFVSYRDFNFYFFKITVWYGENEKNVGLFFFSKNINLEFIDFGVKKS